MAKGGSSSSKAMKVAKVQKVSKGKSKSKKDSSKAKAVQGPHQALTLEEKLEMWRQRQDFSAPLGLDTTQQKQLSSKFKTAIVKAGSEANSVWSEACKAPAGLKLDAKQTVVKSWIMDKTRGQTFTKYAEKIIQDKSLKQEEEPMSMKELLNKYTDQEVQDLLETGGISERRHSSRG